MIGFLKSLSRNRLSLAGLVVITAVIFVALVTPLLPLPDPDVIDTKNRFKTPEGYFENISSNNLLFSNKNNFKTPLNYFETIKFDFSNQKTKSKRFLIKNIIKEFDTNDLVFTNDCLKFIISFVFEFWTKILISSVFHDGKVVFAKYFINLKFPLDIAIVLFV